MGRQVNSRRRLDRREPGGRRKIRPRGNLREMSDREHLMVSGDATHRLSNHQTDPSANARVHFVEDERWHAIESCENRLQRQHHAGKLATRGDARERALLMADVQRHAELDVFGAARSDLGQRLEPYREVAVGHSQIRQHLIDAARQPSRRRLPQFGEGRRSFLEPSARLTLARLELAQIEAGGIDEIQLLTGATPGLDHLGKRTAVFLR